MILRSFATLTLCLCSILMNHQAAQAEDPPIPIKFAEVEVAPDYYERIRQLCQNHVCNHKVVAKLKMWDPLKYDLKNVVLQDKYEIYGEKAWLQKTVSKNKDGSIDEAFSFMNTDAYYVFGLGEKSSKYQIHEHLVEWNKPEKFYSSFMEHMATSAQIYNFAIYQNDKLVGTPEGVEYDGRASLRLNFTTPENSTRTLYIDRQTYQFLYSESPHIMRFMQGKIPMGSMTFAQTQYRDVGGKRLPVSYVTGWKKPSGEKLPFLEYEFTEYLPYKPTADELNLEKQFGIKPIAHEPRPDSAKVKSKMGSRARWWYVAAGALFVVMVGLILAARKRRVSHESPSAP
jgi:hypothetical protein